MPDSKETYRRPIKTCNDNHEEIAFYSSDCPLCKERLQFDKLLDDREDIDQQNITRLFDQLKALTADVRGIETYLGIRKRTFFDIKPLRYARQTHDAQVERGIFEH